MVDLDSFAFRPWTYLFTFFFPNALLYRIASFFYSLSSVIYGFLFLRLRLRQA